MIFYYVIRKYYHIVECYNFPIKSLTEKVSQNVSATQFEKAQKYNEAAKGAFSENTERARKADWKIFQAWYDENHQNSLPASTDMLVAFTMPKRRLNAHHLPLS